MTARVAIAVACYRHGEYLGAMLDSLRAQTMPDWECAVVIDGPDADAESAAAARVERDARIRVEVLPAWQGVPIATNRAVALTTAPWLITFGADDLMDPTFLDELLNAVSDLPQTQPPYSIVFTPARQVYPDGRVAVYRYPPYRRERMADLPHMPGPSLQPRALWEQLGGLDPVWCEGATDWMYYVRAAALDLLHPIQLTMPRWTYRQHDGFRNHRRGVKQLHRLKPEMQRALRGERAVGEPIPD